MIASMLSITFLHLFGVYGLSPIFALSLTLICTVPLAALLGYSIERIAYRPLRHAPKLAPLISAIGVSIVLQNLAQLIWGTGNIAFPMPFSNTPFSLWGGEHYPVAGAYFDDGKCDDGGFIFIN
jgi:branched-chain amino acid transport system permease protein